MTTAKTVVGVALLGAVAGGAAGGAMVAALSGNSKEAVRAELANEAQEGTEQDMPESSRLEVRIAELEGRLSTLQRQAQTRNKLQKYANTLNSGNEAEGEAQAESPSAGLQGVVDAEDPGFELAVRGVMDRIDWEKNEEQKARQAQRHEERAQRQTDLLAQRLNLNAQQRQALARALSQQMERFRALRDPDARAGEPPATRSEWRERIRAIRGQTEAELQTVLTAEQMDGYKEFVEEEGFGRGGRRERNR